MPIGVMMVRGVTRGVGRGVAGGGGDDPGRMIMGVGVGIGVLVASGKGVASGSSVSGVAVGDGVAVGRGVGDGVLTFALELVFDVGADELKLPLRLKSNPVFRLTLAFVFALLAFVFAAERSR